MLVKEDEPDLETVFKVIAIMQTITEDLDESGKSAWRKMLGIKTEAATPSTSDNKRELEQSYSDIE